MTVLTIFDAAATYTFIICLLIAAGFQILFVIFYKFLKNDMNAAVAAVGIIHAALGIATSAYTLVYYDPLETPKTYDHFCILSGLKLQL